MEAEQRVHFLAISMTCDPCFNALRVAESDTRSPALQTGSIRLHLVLRLYLLIAVREHFKEMLLSCDTPLLNLIMAICSRSGRLYDVYRPLVGSTNGMKNEEYLILPIVRAVGGFLEVFFR